MKIIELHVENFKRLKAVTIRPGENNVVEISGRNAQGKSSAIDAIWAALQGSAALRSTPAPVRKGAEKAEIRLDLGKYVVTRNWTATENTYLTVTTGGEFKAKLNSPQKLLDNLVGDLCFDPLAFTRLGDKEQADMVLSLLRLDLGDLPRGQARFPVGQEQRGAPDFTLAAEAAYEWFAAHGARFFRTPQGEPFMFFEDTILRMDTTDQSRNLPSIAGISGCPLIDAEGRIKTGWFIASGETPPDVPLEEATVARDSSLTA